MLEAKITLTDMLSYDDTILDALELPENLEPERENIQHNIILETKPFNILYTDPALLKWAIGVWSKKMLGVWTELEATLHYEYDPISNYDRKEEWEDVRTLDQDSTNNLQHGEQVSTVGTNDTTVENQITGFNSENYGNLDKSTSDMDTTGTETHSGTDQNTGTLDQTENVTREGRAYGNIGVTTTQQMIEAQRQVVLFNIVDSITSDFKKRFCVLVY